MSRQASLASPWKVSPVCGKVNSVLWDPGRGGKGAGGLLGQRARAWDPGSGPRSVPLSQLLLASNCGILDS